MPNDQSFPGIQQIKDSATQTAIRFVWDKLQALSNTVRTPKSGTLSPDQKPRLSTSEAGAKFFSTDFNREYQWTGRAWIDSPTAPPRGQTAYFDPTLGPAPSIGWIACDGRSTPASTSAGGTTYYTTPILPPSGPLRAYIRV